MQKKQTKKYEISPTKEFTNLLEKEIRKQPLLSITPELLLIAYSWDLDIFPTPLGIVSKGKDLEIAVKILVNSVKNN